MFLTEYNQDKVWEQERREVERMTYEKVATNMLRDGEPLAKIAKYSCLAEEVILRLAKTLGISTSQGLAISLHNFTRL